MSTSTKPPALRVLHLTRVTNPGARAFARRSAPIEYARQLPGGRPMTFFLDWPTLATTLEAPAKTTDAGLARGIGRMLREALLPSGWAAAEAELLAALKGGPATLLIQLNADELYGLPWEAMPLNESGPPLADVPGLRVLYDEPRALRWTMPAEPPRTPLLVWSAQGGAVPHERVAEALGPSTTPMRDPSLTQIVAALRTGQHDALVLLAHGTRSVDNRIVLRWGAEHIDAAQLVTAIEELPERPRRVALLACRGGEEPIHSLGYGGFGLELHRHGVGAVLASRWNLSAEAAVALAKALGSPDPRAALPLGTVDRLGVVYFGSGVVGHGAVERRLAGETSLGETLSRPAAAPIPTAVLDRFVGRVEQLAALSRALTPEPGPAQAAVVCNLQGMAGVGKSLLVERFFQLHGGSFPGGHLKITLGYDAFPTDVGLLNDLAERLGVLQGPGRVEDRARDAALATRALVHVDNLDTEAQAGAAVMLVRRLPGVPIVLSGRYQFGRATPGWRLLQIEPFSVPVALAQLDAELLPEVAARSDDHARRALVGALGGLPLAIHLAASYLNAGYEVQDFLEALAASGLSLKPFTASDTAYHDRAERALRATFELSLDALRAELGEEADAGVRGVAALGVAPLVGVGRSWMEAMVAGPPGRSFRWVSLAVKLSIVQHDVKKGRWRVHKLLGEMLRGLVNTVVAVMRMDVWVLERQLKDPEETRGARWGALQAEHEAVAEWVAGLDGARAVVGGLRGYFYASASGPYAVWLDAIARGLQSTQDARARSNLLWCQGSLARQAGDLDLALSAAKLKAEHDAAQGWELEVAYADGLRADVIEAQGQLDEALRVRREEQLPAYERLGDAHSKALTISRIADLLQARGQLDEAVRLWREEVLPVLERLGDVRNKAVSMGKIAEVLEAWGQLGEALRLLREEELPVYERLGDLQAKAVTMGKIADLLQKQGQLDEASRSRREEELPIYERLGDVRATAITMGKIADVHEAQGRPDEAQRLRREEALPVYERLGDVRSKAVTIGNIADALQARGQLDEANRLQREEVLPLFQRLGDVYSEAITMSKIADIHQARGQLDEAVRLRREEVLPIFERLGAVREKAITIGKIADVHQARGQLDEADRLRREEQLPVFERIGDVRETAVVMSKIADALHTRGQLDEANRIRREEVLPVFVRLGDACQTAVTVGKIADVYQSRGQLDEALRVRQEEELPVYERLGNVRSTAITMGKVADVYEARGQLDEALRIRREEELAVFERLGDVHAKAHTMGKIASVLQKLGQVDEALQLQREALPIYEALGDRRGLMVNQANLAVYLLRLRRAPEHRAEAVTLLTAALQSALDLKYLAEAEHIRGLFHDFDLPLPT